MSTNEVKETIYGCIPSEWDVKKIIEYTEIVTDYIANGSFASLKKNVQYKDEADVAVLIRLVDFNNNFNGEFVYINEDSYNFLKKSKLYGDEIIISNVGANVGTVFKCPRLKYKMSLAPNSIMMRTKGHDDFYYYWLKSGYGQYALKSIVSGSAQPKFNKTDFRNLTVPVPPLEEQKAIAATLSCLDDKIELNNRINKTLEEMAQAIFKSWFVDFEPFQDGEFEDTEIGKIPKGWNIKPLYDLADYINGTSFKKHEYSTSGYPIIKIAELKNGITNSTQYFNGVKDSKYYIKTGDILFSWSGNPQTSIDTFVWVGGNAILNQHTFKISIKNDDYSFVFLLLKNFKPEFTRIARGKQTTGLGHVTVGDLKRLKFPFNDKAVSEFTTVLNPIIKKYVNNLLENSKLNAARDNLLPKLISGEIRVSVEEVE